MAPPRRKYALPLPLRTFPLPTFYPSNPVSLVHLAFAWMWQVLLPPAAEPATVHEGVWSAATRSVHVTDPRSMNDLWCQGFYGKGSLSRSEPSWLNREKARRAAAQLDSSSGTTVTTTSEQRTNKRREERADTKWERGRTELEAIEQRRREEEATELAAKTAKEAEKAKEVDLDKPNGHADPNLAAQSLPSPPPSPPPSPVPVALPKAPVGPLELLALPNSEADLRETRRAATAAAAAAATSPRPHLNGSASGTKTDPPKSHVNGSAVSLQDLVINGTQSTHSSKEENHDGANGIAVNEEKKAKSYGDLGDVSVDGNDTRPIEPLKRQKSVRFSPTVESTTFVHSDPPSPNHNASVLKGAAPVTSPTPTVVDASDIPNKEHLQLSPEEAFFLAYAVGALRVVDPETQQVLSTQRLFELCRGASNLSSTSSSSPSSSSSSSSSSSPSSSSSTTSSPKPTDDFLLHYAVYHHFRSLGWVPRHGIKFGVDWMLYGKGPALDHAEFGVMVVPSYTDRWWRQNGQTPPSPPTPSWHWLHSVNRVLSTVYKSLVLVYVDVPPPAETGNVVVNDISALLARYRIREVMVRRWSSNRNRD